ncbi:MAG: hypothetical protein R3E79_40605 [Caldilineaceae bacterium]
MDTVAPGAPYQPTIRDLILLEVPVGVKGAPNGEPRRHHRAHYQLAGELLRNHLPSA